jgi:hypothetical protein
MVSLHSTAQIGNVGIGTTTPKARLHVTDSSVVFSANGHVTGLLGKPPIEGAGKRMMWYVDKAAFRAGHVWGSNWDKDNIGDYSFAAGDDNMASGLLSTAFGGNGTAKGWYSFVAGVQNNASSVGGVALGYTNDARNMFSVAIGSNLLTRSVGSVTLGNQNDTSDVQNPEGSGQFTDRLFQLGNGFGATRSNAITVLKNGYTGIGALLPKAKLQVSEGSVVFNTNGYVSGTIENPPVEGAGKRMMWYADKAAFRAGHVWGSNWDKDNIGDYSFAAGDDNIASGIYSTAMGVNENAKGWYSFVAGAQNTALSTAGVGIGYLNEARNMWSVAIGSNLITKTVSGVSLGANNDTSDVQTSEGFSQPTDRIFQLGNGGGNIRSNAITVLRNGNAGFGTVNPSKKLEVIGAASATPVTLVIGNRGGFGPAALEFVSDYGLSSQWRPGYIRSNDAGSFTGDLAFYTNGTGSTNLYGNVMGLLIRNGMAFTQTGAVGSFSDARLKNNITPFTDGLNVINKINPVQFYYNADAPFTTSQQQTGIIAQELEKVAPYMVDKNKQNGYDDLRSVNNQAYTFLLINAIKELAQQNIDLNKRLEMLEKEIMSKK